MLFYYFNARHLGLIICSNPAFNVVKIKKLRITTIIQTQTQAQIQTQIQTQTQAQAQTQTQTQIKTQAQTQTQTQTQAQIQTQTCSKSQFYEGDPVYNFFIVMHTVGTRNYKNIVVFVLSDKICKYFNWYIFEDIQGTV